MYNKRQESNVIASVADYPRGRVAEPYRPGHLKDCDFVEMNSHYVSLFLLKERRR